MISNAAALPAQCAGRAFFVGGDDQRIAAARQFAQGEFTSPEHKKGPGSPAGLGPLGSIPTNEELMIAMDAAAIARS